MNQVATVEEKIAQRIDTGIAGSLTVSDRAGGLDFNNASQAMEFAKMMSISAVAVPKHLRGNPGACLAVVIQAIEWRLSPYAVANKSYSVNDRLAYESQLVQAVILQRAPIKGRFKVEFNGEGEKRVCRVWAELKETGEVVDYISPPFGKITPKNSPLWKSDPDQQHFYYSGRALCRRHFPDVLLGVYARDEIEEGENVGPDKARDVTPARPSLSEKLDALAAPKTEAIDPDTGEIHEGDSEPQASPPAREEPAAADSPDDADGAARQAPQAVAEPSATDTPQEARLRGAEAFRAGALRKAAPGAYRGTDRLLDWQDGWSEAAKAADAS